MVAMCLVSLCAITTAVLLKEVLIPAAATVGVRK